MGKYDEALTEFNEAISLYPSSSAALEDRAKLYRKIGEEKKALADETEAKRLKRKPAVKKI